VPALGTEQLGGIGVGSAERNQHQRPIRRGRGPVALVRASVQAWPDKRVDVGIDPIGVRLQDPGNQHDAPRWSASTLARCTASAPHRQAHRQSTGLSGEPPSSRGGWWECARRGAYPSYRG
jgi:hypothetical protein